MVVQDEKMPASEGVERVPTETYIPDAMWEEERIMAERASPERTLDTHALRIPVKALGLGPPTTVLPSTSIREAVEVMQRGSFGCVLVVDALGALVGIFTERDLLRKIAGRKLDWGTERVADHMTQNPETLPDTANLAFVLNVMIMGGFRHVPIVDGDRTPTCVVSIRDVVGYISSFFEKEVENLPPRPDLRHPTVRESV